MCCPVPCTKRVAEQSSSKTRAIRDRCSLQGRRYYNSEEAHLLTYRNQSRFIEFAVDEIEKLLPGEIELFCHTGDQLITDLLCTMGNPCTDSSIATVI